MTLPSHYSDVCVSPPLEGRKTEAILLGTYQTLQRYSRTPEWRGVVRLVLPFTRASIGMTRRPYTDTPMYLGGGYMGVFLGAPGLWKRRGLM